MMYMFFKRKKRKIISISGMKDETCVTKIDRALEELSDVEYAKINLNKGTATVFYDNDVDSLKLQNTIEELGYIVTGIKEVQ